MGSVHLMGPGKLNGKKMNLNHVYFFFCLFPSPTFCPKFPLLDLSPTAVPCPSVEMCLEWAPCLMVGDDASRNRPSDASR